LITVVTFALVHVSGEVLYKVGGEKLLSERRNVESVWKSNLFPIMLTLFSISISMVVKVLYGVLLGTNPLSITAGMFLGIIALLSIIFGAIIFHEKLSIIQVIGALLVAIGIFLLV
jgi:drug/metabolite transporter (DMT)-like permease